MCGTCEFCFKFLFESIYPNAGEPIWRFQLVHGQKENKKYSHIKTSC